MSIADRFRKPPAPQTQYFEFGRDSALQIEQLIKAVKDSNDLSLHQKLDAVIEMLRTQADVATNLALVREQLNIIHGLIADIASADPEKIKELAASVKTVREKLQTSVDKQPEGD